MIFTSDLYESICSEICLGVSAKYELRKILRQLDGETLENDLPDELTEEE